MNQNNEISSTEVKQGRDKKKTIKIVIISIVSASILIIAGLLLYTLLDSKNEVTYKNKYPLYQYFSGVKSEYEGEITLRKDGSITKIENSYGVENIDSSPIYFEETSNKLLTTKDMLLVFPRSNTKNYKIKFFTEIYYDKDGEIPYELLNNKKVFLNNTFLYDGENMYVFLNQTDVTLEKEKVTLSPLSYIIVNYHGDVEYYDYESDTYKIVEDTKNDVIATVDGIEINLSTDMVMNDENGRILLKNISNLRVYEENE